MSTSDYAAQKLQHIRAMIALLDQVLQDNRNRQVTSVMSPDDWRVRIEALLAERLSSTLEQQVHALLERLDAMGSQHRCDRRGMGLPAPKALAHCRLTGGRSRATGHGV